MMKSKLWLEMMKIKLWLEMMKSKLWLEMMKMMRRLVMTVIEEKRENTVYLPEDLLVEILSRVPEASLARFRSTSKGWNALIKKDEILAKKSFVILLIDFRVYLARLDLHGIHDDKVLKVTNQFSLKDPLSPSSEEVNIREVFHCNGLLLCTTVDDRLVVCNPFSGEISWIVQPINSYYKADTYALGKSSCNKYKILRVHHHGHGYYGQCLVEYEIYDFTSNSWRVVGETREWNIPGMWRLGTSVGENTYWLAFTFSQDLRKTEHILLSFDFSTERFESLSLPDDISYKAFVLSVTREEKKLCLLASRCKVFDIDVWMATKIKSTGAMSWSKIVTVKRTYDNQFLRLYTGMSFLADRENKVLVCRPSNLDNSNSFLHIMGEDKYIHVDHHDARSKCSLPSGVVQLMVQIQQGSLGVGTWKVPIT